MRSQNIKYNSFGKVGGESCLLLLLMAFLMVNPMISSAAFAKEGNEEGAIEEASNELQAQAIDPVVSTVNIEFSPASGSASMTPITAAGAASRFSVTATVRVQNSGGYDVYFGSNSNKLTRVGGTETIEPIAGSVNYENLATNTWGYAYVEGETITDTVQYSAVPNNLRSADSWIDGNSSTNIKDETKTYTMSFAAKIGSDKPTGTYSNSVTMSVVSSPLEITGLSSISDLQEMTTVICEASELNETKQLRDVRDGKYYWVTKLADNNCWMTQNLDLDLSTSKKLTYDTSDVPTAGWTPGFNTATTATSSTVNPSSQIETRSWSLGNYRITAPDISSDCGSSKNSAANCSSQFTAYTTPTSANGDTNAHYILGNHYQWNAVTAGTGGAITSGQASSSICPKGWRLPTSSTGGEFATLVTKLGGTSSTSNVTKAPFYGVRGGYVDQYSNYLFAAAANTGYYWSSTPVSNGGSTYNLFFRETNSVMPSNSIDRNYGFTVRCVAR